MEHENKASGTAKTALGLSIGALGVEALTGGLNGLLNGIGRGNTVDSALLGAMVANNNCSEDHLINRYEAGQSARIAQLETEVKLRDANIYTDQKLLEVYKYFDGENKAIREELCKQRVHNQRTEDSFVLAQSDLAATKAELYGAIRNEAEKRCCGDNAIVNYVNATFYPKMVADVTTGTTTTAQVLYDPLPNCGCCNK